MAGALLGHYAPVAAKAWWKDWRQLPPQMARNVDRQRGHDLTSSELTAARLSLLAALALVVALAVAGRWYLALIPVFSTLLWWLLLPRQHRARILGRPTP